MEELLQFVHLRKLVFNRDVFMPHVDYERTTSETILIILARLPRLECLNIAGVEKSVDGWSFGFTKTDEWKDRKWWS